VEAAIGVGEMTVGFVEGTVDVEDVAGASNVASGVSDDVETTVSGTISGAIVSGAAMNIGTNGAAVAERDEWRAVWYGPAIDAAASEVGMGESSFLL
jgi:hypothetical protein